MSPENKTEVSDIMEYVKSANLKGSLEIGENEFLWNLGGIYLRFNLDDCETTISYSRHRNQVFDIGHFHEDNNNVIDLIKNINCEDKRVQISVYLLASNFRLVDKTDKRKRNWLIIRHYYSSL